MSLCQSLVYSILVLSRAEGFCLPGALLLACGGDAVTKVRVVIFPNRIVTGLRAHGPWGTLVYALGRFSRVRRAYGVVQAARQRLLGFEPSIADTVSIFPTLPIDDAV